MLGPCNAFLDQFWEEFPMAILTPPAALPLMSRHIVRTTNLQVPGFRQHFADGVHDFERLADEVAVVVAY